MKCRSYLKHARFRFAVSGQQFTPKQLASFYGFPAGFTGAGIKVAIIELGGGYVQKDLDTYFHGLGLPNVKPVVFHSVNGAVNTPGDPNGADGEVMLDLCVIGAMAPGVEMHLYMAGNNDADYLAAFKQARLDGMHIISNSWGGPEDQWNPASIAAFDAEFATAVAAGITITCAAGDNGSSDGEAGKHVDFPSSSPHVLGCGGTAINSTSPVVETVWNDGSQGGATGGGVSALFPLPSWQSAANVVGGKYRGVPDVAGNADPNTGWIVIVDGQQMVIGGTSAVAPMWAALVACLSQALGKNVGFINPSLYSLSGWQRDITSGNNGVYTARSGYDCCTGMGVPIGSKLLAALQGTVAPPVNPTPPAPTATSHTIVVTGASAITLDGKALV